MNTPKSKFDWLYKPSCRGQAARSKLRTALALGLVMLSGLGVAWTAESEVSKKGEARVDTSTAEPQSPNDDVAYRAITQNILTKVAALKSQFPILEKMQIPEVAANGEATLEFEHGVQWVLDDPTQKASKTNGRRAVFERGGLHFRLHFYRDRWEGAARFNPVNFGDINLWGSPMNIGREKIRPSLSPSRKSLKRRNGSTRASKCARCESRTTRWKCPSATTLCL